MSMIAWKELCSPDFFGSPTFFCKDSTNGVELKHWPMLWKFLLLGPV